MAGESARSEVWEAKDTEKKNDMVSYSNTLFAKDNAKLDEEFGSVANRLNQMPDQVANRSRRFGSGLFQATTATSPLTFGVPQDYIDGQVTKGQVEQAMARLQAAERQDEISRAISGGDWEKAQQRLPSMDDRTKDVVHLIFDANGLSKRWSFFAQNPNVPFDRYAELASYTKMHGELEAAAFELEQGRIPPIPNTFGQQPLNSLHIALGNLSGFAFNLGLVSSDTALRDMMQAVSPDEFAPTLEPPSFLGPR